MKFVRGFIWIVWIILMIGMTVLTFLIPEEWTFGWVAFALGVLILSTRFLIWVDSSTRKEE